MRCIQLPPLVVVGAVVGVVVGAVVGAVVGGAVVGGGVVGGAVVGGAVVGGAVVGGAVVCGGAVVAVVAGGAVVDGSVGAAVGAVVASVAGALDSLETGAVVAGPAAVACVSAGAALDGVDELVARGSTSVSIPPTVAATDGVAPPDSSRSGLDPIAALAPSAAPRSDAARFTSASDSASAEMTQATTTYEVAPTAPSTARVRLAGWVR